MVQIMGSTPSNIYFANTHAGNLHLDITLQSPIDPRNITNRTYEVVEDCYKDQVGLNCNEQDGDYSVNLNTLSSTHYSLDFDLHSPFTGYGPNICCYVRYFTYGTTIGIASDFGSPSTNYIVIESGAALSVPEPAEWALMITGFGLIGCIARARRSAAPSQA